MDNEIIVKLSVDNESQYFHMLHGVIESFGKLLEMSEQNRFELQKELKDLNEKYLKVKDAGSFQSLLEQYQIESRGNSITDMINAIGNEICRLKTCANESDGAFKEIQLIVGTSASWNDLITNIKKKKVEVDGINGSILSLVNEFRIDSNSEIVAEHILSIKKKLKDLQTENDNNAEIRRQINQCLFEEEKNEEWSNLVVEIKELKERLNSCQEESQSQKNHIDRMIHERFDEIESAVQKDIETCKNESLKVYLQEFIDENKRWNVDQDSILREFKKSSLLPPLYNLIWWNEQEMLKPFLSEITSLSKIDQLLKEILVLSEINGYRIVAPKGKMSDKLIGYEDVNLAPGKYKKIFEEVDYPQMGDVCMIYSMAITEISSNEESGGKFYRFNK